MGARHKADCSRSEMETDHSGERKEKRGTGDRVGQKCDARKKTEKKTHAEVGSEKKEGGKNAAMDAGWRAKNAERGWARGG